MKRSKIRNTYLSQIVRKELLDLGLTLLDKGKHLSSIITVKIPGKESTEVLQFLRNKNINTSITQRSSAVIDFDAKGVNWALRISRIIIILREEIGLLVDALQELIK